MADGKVEGLLRDGREPGRGLDERRRFSARGCAQLEWLVVRDLFDDRDGRVLERRARGRERRDAPRGHPAPRSSSCPPPRTPRRTAPSPTRSGCCSGTTRRSSRRGDCRSELHFVYHLGPAAASSCYARLDATRRDRPLRDLDLGLPDARAASRSRAPRRCSREINGYDRGRPASRWRVHRSSRTTARTACGCWIYTRLLRGRREPDRAAQAARHEQNWVAPEWGWAWPANRRMLYNRASADPEGTPLVRAQAATSGGTTAKGEWTGYGHAGLHRRPAARRTVPARRRTRARDAIGGNDPFIMKADGKGWLFAPSGLARRAAARPTTSRTSRRSQNALYGAAVQPGAACEWRRPDNPLPPGLRRSARIPYVLTTYRLTEHHTAGGMSRWLSWLAELQPEMFCEISPGAGRGERPDATAAGSRSRTARGRDRGAGAGHGADAAAATSGRARRAPDRPALALGRRAGSSTGDVANDLIAFVADPNVHIQEAKAFTVRHPPGPAARRVGTSAPSPSAALGASARGALAQARSTHERQEVAMAARRASSPTRRVCIGCKACEVACKQWNQLPDDGLRLHRRCRTTTPAQLGASTWRHVAFVEQVPAQASRATDGRRRHSRG